MVHDPFGRFEQATITDVLANHPELTQEDLKNVIQDLVSFSAQNNRICTANVLEALVATGLRDLVQARQEELSQERERVRQETFERTKELLPKPNQLVKPWGSKIAHIVSSDPPTTYGSDGTAVTNTVCGGHMLAPPRGEADWVIVSNVDTHVCKMCKAKKKS